MKLKSLLYIAASFPLLAGLSACMDFDTPSDEFAENEKSVDVTVFKGMPDSLNYEYQPDEDRVNIAVDSLTDCFDQMITAM